MIKKQKQQKILPKDRWTCKKKQESSESVEKRQPNMFLSFEYIVYLPETFWDTYEYFVKRSICLDGPGMYGHCLGEKFQGFLAEHQ